MPEHTETSYTGTISDAGTLPPPPPRASRSRVFMSRTSQAARVGVTMGSALAITISWSEHHAILWAVIHGFLSWVYVVYYAMTR